MTTFILFGYFLHEKIVYRWFYVLHHYKEKWFINTLRIYIENLILQILGYHLFCPCEKSWIHTVNKYIGWRWTYRCLYLTFEQHMLAAERNWGGVSYTPPFQDHHPLAGWFVSSHLIMCACSSMPRLFTYSVGSILRRDIAVFERKAVFV